MVATPAGSGQARDGQERYRAAGVDIAAGQAFVDRIKPLAGSTVRPGSEAALGGFGAVFDLRAAGFRDPLLVSTTDGVGTKLLLAQAAGHLAGIGVDLVAMCVNDLVVVGATPLFFLDYLATGKLEIDAAATILDGVAAACREAGCALAGGETAEMPGLYARGHFDLAGFAVGAVERDDLLPRVDIAAGDRLLGLASSGVHSNGFALVRLILDETRAPLDGPAPFAPDLALGRALLTPTRLYVKAALAAARTGAVKAMAHVTGGGLIENLPRVLPTGVRARIDAASWPLPPVFAWLMREGRIGVREMARTYNAGIGLVVIAEAERAGLVARTLSEAGETVYQIGEIVAGEGSASVDLVNAGASWTVNA